MSMNVSAVCTKVLIAFTEPPAATQPAETTLLDPGKPGDLEARAQTRRGHGERARARGAANYAKLSQEDTHFLTNTPKRYGLPSLCCVITPNDTHKELGGDAHISDTTYLKSIT